MKAIEEIKKN